MQRNIYQQPQSIRKTRWSSWGLLVLSLAVFVFVAVSIFDLGSAYLANQRLRSEQARLEAEIGRIRELFTTEDGQTMYDLYLHNNDHAVIVIPIN